MRKPQQPMWQNNTSNCRFETFSFQAGHLPHQGLHKLPLQGCGNTQMPPHCEALWVSPPALSNIAWKEPQHVCREITSMPHLVWCFLCEDGLPLFSEHSSSLPSHLQAQLPGTLIWDCTLKDAKWKAVMNNLCKHKKFCKKDYIPGQTSNKATSLTIALPLQHPQAC